MKKHFWKYFAVLAMLPCRALAQTPATAATPLSWEQVRQRFEQNNPTLRAGQIGIDESKAQESTAFLRPNPNFTLSTEGTQIARYKGVWQPFIGTQFATALRGPRSRATKEYGSPSLVRSLRPRLAICTSDSTKGSCA